MKRRRRYRGSGYRLAMLALPRAGARCASASTASKPMSWAVVPRRWGCPSGSAASIGRPWGAPCQRAWLPARFARQDTRPWESFRASGVPEATARGLLNLVSIETLATSRASRSACSEPQVRPPASPTDSTGCRRLHNWLGDRPLAKETGAGGPGGLQQALFLSAPYAAAAPQIRARRRTPRADQNKDVRVRHQ